MTVAHTGDPVWWPGIAACLCFGIWWAVIARCWSSRVELPGRAWLPIPFLLASLTAEILYNATNLQWIASCILIQQLFMRPPSGLTGRIAEALMVAVVGLTGPFCILFWPIYSWDAWRRPRHGFRIAQWAVLSACAVVQAWFILNDPNPPQQPPLGPVEALKLATACGQRLMVPFLGRAVVEALPAPAWFLFLPVLAWAVAVALRHTANRRIWLTTLAVLAVLLAAGLARARLDQAPLEWIGIADRYFFAPRVLIGWMLIWAAVEAWRWRRVARAIAVIALCLHLPAYRMGPYPDMEWSRHCDALRRGEEASIPILPDWTFKFPAMKRD